MPEILAILLLVFAVYVAVKVLYVVLRVIFAVLGGVLRVVATLIALPFHLLGYVLRAGGSVAPAPQLASGGPVLGVPCGNRVCLCPNIAGARFCRRCGTDLRHISVDDGLCRLLERERRSMWS